MSRDNSMSEACLGCSGPVEQTGRGRPRKWCTGCRPSIQPRPRPPADPRSERPCAECGAMTLRMYCSQRCRDLSKRVPCAGDCGGLIHLGRGSLPAGQARCRPCRIAANHAARDYESIAERQRAQVRAANMSPCVNCGAASYGVRCRRCENTSRRGGVPISDTTPARKLLDARRADRDKLAPGIYTPYKRQQLRDRWKRQGKRCLYCGDAPAQTVDHVLPLALGGTNHEGNLAPACYECNRLKQDNLLSAWRYGVKVRRWRVPVEPRMPKPRPRRKQSWVQTALNMCAICGALHTRVRSKYCSGDCMWEANARRARDKYRLEQGLPVDASAPTKPSRRVRSAA